MSEDINNYDENYDGDINSNDDNFSENEDSSIVDDKKNLVNP